MKELFQDLVVEIAFKSSALKTPILATKEAKIKVRLKGIRGTN